MNFGNIVGQTLDGKYRIERELGRGGMGAVYLATHLGTERPVAVKVIVPEFMERAEFVERFRREARAAGRLRHPNVVDVTDFGIAETLFGNVAYLVMEYLDGCTLGEILEEEKHIPVAWTIDILEQVCSAVGEAHQQGIIHRDLKPDNIWLEPNLRGGYTVKVLDFGIAKLETPDKAENAGSPPDAEDTVRRGARKTLTGKSGTGRKTLAGGEQNSPTAAGNKDLTAAASESDTFIGDATDTAIFESKTLVERDEPNTLIYKNDSEKKSGPASTAVQNAQENAEKKTAILPAGENHSDPADDEAGTRMMTPHDLELNDGKSSPNLDTNLGGKTTRELTKVGAVLGTPLYMSPEQCRGEHLTPQSDIYSLAVIAYQMLGGKTPFDGNFTDVMEAHKTAEPPPLKSKKIPPRLKKLVLGAMAKNTEDRPKDAEAFATVLRAQSEGLGALYRHAITIYGEHLPKFLLISAVVFLPVTLLSIIPLIFKLLQYFGMVESVVLTAIGGISTVLATLAGFFFGAVGFGTVTLLVTRHLSAPLRPLDLKSAFRTVRQKWKTIFGLVSITTLVIVCSLIAGLIPLALVIVMAGFLQSISTVLAAVIGGLLAPAALIFALGFLVYVTSRFGFVTPAIVMEDLKGRAALRRSKELFKRAPWKVAALTSANFILPIIVSSLIMIFIAAVIGNIPSDNQFLRGMGSRKSNEAIIRENEEKQADGAAEKPKEQNVEINIGTRNAPSVTYDTTDEDAATSNRREKEKLSERDKYARGAGQSLRELLFQLIWFPVAILITSFTQVLMALMYVKTRQAGGEPMRDLLKQFEDDDKPQTRWQKRIQKRLLQSGRITGKT